MTNDERNRIVSTYDISDSVPDWDDWDEPAEPPLQIERRHLTYEVIAIEKILAVDQKYGLVTPRQWYERLTQVRERIAEIDTELNQTEVGQ